MKKTISIAIVLVILVCFLTACGSNNTNNTPQTEKPAINSAETGIPAAPAQQPASAGANIDANTARQSALTDAGISEEEAVFTKVCLDFDDGRQEWEVEFVSGENRYEYDINAADGAVIKSSVRPIMNAAGAPADISAERAEEIALDAFKIPSDEAVFTKVELDFDDGIQIWEISYVSGQSKHEVEINAVDGTVYESSSEMLRIEQ